MAEDINLIQKEVLTKDIISNSYFKPSPIPSRNFELQTDKKNMIHAINEIKKDTEISITSIDKKVEDNNTKVDNVYKNVNVINNDVAEIKEKIISVEAGSKPSRPICNYIDCLYNYEVIDEGNGYKYAKYSLDKYDESMGIPNRIIIYLVKDKSTSIKQYTGESTTLPNITYHDCICDSKNGEISISKCVNNDGKIEYFLQNINFGYMEYFWQNNQFFNKFVLNGFITRFAYGESNLHLFKKYTDTQVSGMFSSSYIKDKARYVSNLSKYNVRLVF